MSGSSSNFWVRINVPNAPRLSPNATVCLVSSSVFLVANFAVIPDLSVQLPSIPARNTFSTVNGGAVTTVGRATWILTSQWQAGRLGNAPVPIGAVDILQGGLLNVRVFDEVTGVEVALGREWSMTLQFEDDVDA